MRNPPLGLSHRPLGNEPRDRLSPRPLPLARGLVAASVGPGLNPGGRRAGLIPSKLTLGAAVVVEGARVVVLEGFSVVVVGRLLLNEL